MNEHLYEMNPTLMSKNPVVNTGQALSDCAAWFASANKEYLTIPSNASLQTGATSYEFADWLRFDTVGTVDCVVGKDGEWKIDLASNILRFGTYASGAWTYVSASVFGALSTATWYWVRVWRDAVAGTINISVNNGVANSASADANTAGSNPLVFGKGTGYYNGRMDSAYWTKRISTPTETAILYAGVDNRIGLTSTLAISLLPTFWSNLISWWDFNSESGTQYDSKGSNHLTATADPIISPPVYGSELVVNGGFETISGSDFGTWVGNLGDGSIADEGTIVHSGSHAVKITAVTTSPSIMEDISVTAGANYYLSLWSRGDGTNSPRYAVYDVTNSVFVIAISNTNNTTISYQLFTTQFTAPAGCTSIRIILYTTSASGSISYFDDVSVKQIITPSINNGGFDLRPATGGKKTNVFSVSVARTSNVATIVATGHGLKNNDVVTTTGFTDTSFNVTNKIVTVFDVDTFTFASTGTDVGTTADTGGRISTDVFSSWAEGSYATGYVKADSINAYTGAFCAELYAGTDTNYSQLQTATVKGKAYSLSFYAKTPSGTATLNGQSITSAYALKTITFSANATTYQIQNYSQNNTIYIDNVTLTSLGPTAIDGIAAGNAVDGNFGAGFNGTSQSLSVNDNASVRAGNLDFEVGANVMFDTKSTSTVPGIIGKASASSTAGTEYQLYYDNALDRFRFFISDGSTVKTLSANNFGAPTVGQYYFVRAWHDSVNDTLNIQVNNGTADSTATAGVYPQGANNPLRLGIFGSATYFFPGRIDGAYKINRILTTDEATAIYNNGKGLKYAQLPDSIRLDPLLKGYWNLDEKSGTRYDSTPNANHLTDNGSVAQVQGVNYYEGSVSRWADLTANLAHFNQVTLAKRPAYDSLIWNGKGGLLFDGVDDYLSNASDVAGNGDITAFTVVKPRGWNGGVAPILNNGKFHLYIANGYVRVSSDGVDVATSTTALTLGVSYVISATRRSTGRVTVYINGVADGSLEQVSGTPTAGTPSVIGNSTALDKSFDGHIGRVAVIKRILSLGEIQAISRRLSVECGGIY